jgi:hypothetical protein
VPELGGAIDEQDLVELAEHHCYVRLSSGGKRLPTFSVHLDPPLTPDASVRAALAGQSAERFGRDSSVVDADREAMAARILELHPRPPIAAQEALVAQAPSRNEHRPRKKRRGKPEAVGGVPI